MQNGSRLRVSLVMSMATLAGATALSHSAHVSAGPEDDAVRHVGPLEAIRADAELLKAPARRDGRGRADERAFLGVRPAQRPRDGGEGVEIEEVIKDSSAERAGLQNGDVIVGMNDTRIDTFEQLSRAIGSRRPGDDVEFHIRRRDGASETVAALLGARPERVSGSFGLRRFEGDSFSMAVVPIEFEDTAPATMKDTGDLRRLFFSKGEYVGTGPDGITEVHGSLRDYYHEVSNGKLDVTGRVFEWIKVPYTKDDLRRQALGSGRRMLAKAVELIRERDGADAFDGLDGVAFIVAGAQVVRRPSALWPHRASIRIGERNLPYYLTAEGLERAATIGVHCHEFGHVLGLPDQYGQQHRTGVGVFCIMSVGWRGGGRSGSARPFHPCAWCKERLGWIDPVPLDPRVPQRLRLGPIVGSDVDCYKVLVRPGASEYFLLENRQRRGFDTDFPETGLLIWHLGETGQTRINRVGHAIDLEEAHGLDRIDASLRDVLRIPFPKAGVDRFGPDTTPSSRSRGADAFAIDIRGIREDRRTGEVTFEVVGAAVAAGQPAPGRGGRMGPF